MSTLNDSDLFVIERSGTQYQVRSDEMSTLNDTDLFVVERSGVDYKIEAQYVNTGPTGEIASPVEVLTPVNGAGLNDGSDYNPLSSAITGVAGAGEITVETDEIVGYTSEIMDYSSRVSITGPDAFYPTGNGPDKIFDGNPNTFCAVESSSNSEEVAIVFDATGLNIDTSGNDIIARSAGGWTFKVTGSLGTSSIPISSDSTGTPLPAVGILQEIEVQGNGANWMYLKDGDTYYVDGDNVNTLTLASDKDLVDFTAGDDVEQDSGYTPETSAITNITASTVSKVRGYYSDSVPANLAEAVSGTEFDMTVSGVNVVDNSHFLTLVCDPGCPTSGSVFYQNYGALYDMKYNNGSGNYDANGNRLDAANNPPSGPSDSLDIVFSDGGNTGYIVNTQAAYTVLATIVNSSISRVSDAALGTKEILTLTDDKDLENFRVGDQLNASVPSAGPLENGISYRTSDTASWNSGTKTTVQADAQYTGSDYCMFDATVCTDMQIEGISGTYVLQGTDDPDATSFISVHSGFDASPNLDTLGYRYIAVVAGTETFKIIGTGVTSGTVDVLAIGPGNSMTLNGGTWNTGETVTGPTLAAATGVVASTSGSELTLATSDGRWVTNAGKTATKSAVYDVALTFASDQALDKIIGPAVQVNADGTDYDSVSTSPITNVSSSNTSGVTLQVPDGGTGDWASVVGAPQNTDREPFLFPDGSNATRGKIYFTGMTVGDSITWWGYSSTGGTRNCAGDISQTTVVIPSDPQNPGPVTVTVTAESGYFALDFNGNSATHACYSITPGPGGPATVLTLTDDTNLDQFEPGDEVNVGGVTGLVTTSGATTEVSDVYDQNGVLVSGKDVSAIKDQNYFNPNTNDANKNGNKGIYLQPSSNILEVNYSGVTPGDTITVIYGGAGGGVGSFSITPVGDVQESGTTPTVTNASKDTLPKETLVLTTTKSSGTVTLTGSNTFVQYIEGWYARESATVVSINQSSPEMAVSGGTWNVGDTVSKSLTLATIGSVAAVDGTTLYGSSVTGDGFYVGKYLKGAEITAAAPSPSEVVFTSMNAGTTAFTGTDSTLSGRLWTLESASSASGPWTLLVSTGDTDANASQDGATPWGSAPTLPANTFFRVKVEYQSENALPVQSIYNTFKTGDA